MFTAYGLVSITSTLAGVLIGGISVHKLGGYTSKNAFKLCLAMGFMAALVGTPIPFVDSFALFTIFLWLLLFFGGFIMPSLTGKERLLYYSLGTMISSVPKYSRPYASSLGAIFMNLFGYLPAPFLYGWVDEVTNQ